MKDEPFQDAHRFGENGAALFDLDDIQLQRETSSRGHQLSILSFLAFVSVLILICYMARSRSVSAEPGVFYESLLLLTGAMSLAAGGVGCYQNSQSRQKARHVGAASKTQNHITGFGAFIALLLGLFIGAAFYTGQRFAGGEREFIIPGWMGFLTIGALLGVSVLTFLTSRFSIFGNLDAFMIRIRALTLALNGLGKVLSFMDRILVLAIAPLAGMSCTSALWRYSIFFGQLCASALFSWFAPSHLGLIGTFWAFIVVFSVVRRWGWIEHDRTSRMQNPNIQPVDLRLGLEDDLRDEAVLGLLILVLIIPFGMRQIQLMPFINEAFVSDNGSMNNPLSWIGFFGVELLKALPFLDWSDIYGAHNGAHIRIIGSAGMHALFVSRVIIDLIFLAAIVQAASISVAIAKNKRQFLLKEVGVDRLDSRIERAELRKLAEKKHNTYVATPFLEKFLHYNHLQLTRLKLRYKNDKKLQFVIDEIMRRGHHKYSPPSEQLLELCSMPKPDPKAILTAISLVIDYQDFDDLDRLMAARVVLNNKSGLDAERQRLVQVLLDEVPPSDERHQEIISVLIGEKSDSLLSVRRLVIDNIARHHDRYPDGIKSLYKAAAHDRSKVIRAYARRAIDRFKLQKPGADDKQGLSEVAL